MESQPVYSSEKLSTLLNNVNVNVASLDDKKVSSLTDVVIYLESLSAREAVAVVPNVSFEFLFDFLELDDNNENGWVNVAVE